MNTVRRSGAGGDPVLMSQEIVEDEAGSGKAVRQRDVEGGVQKCPEFFVFGLGLWQHLEIYW